MKTRKYLTSILSHLDDHRLILLIGARQVGKTTLMRLVEQHCIDKNFETAFLSLDDPNILYALNQHPSELLKLVQTPLGKKCFVFIDEVQYLRDPSGFLKYHVDLSPDIKLIVSGSSAFYIDTRFHDSLAGRKWVHEIFPLDFIEWLDFIGHPEMIPVLPEVLKNRDHHKAPLLTNYLDTYILYG